MSDLAIRVEGLGKRYRIGRRERYYALRDVIARSARRLVWWRRDGQPDPESRWIWALRDVSFEVKEGEVVGIIGRNGAGKTTLLKILARITKPTEGYAEVRGRVGSLLEVGTGFHPELTGRENIYLSGALLGMKKREIDRKFDEIVAFAEVEKFIDTPVKYYSSGMYVRLAFAVAAHLEPEILLVDEVLAVGDAAFQKKCLGKMGDVAKEGRTVLFVSHQMNSIRRLCERVMWLEGGKMVDIGPTPHVTAAYERAMTSKDPHRSLSRERPRGVKARFLGWEIVTPRSSEPHVLRDLAPTTIVFHVWAREQLRSCHHGIVLYDVEGQKVWGWAIDRLSVPAGVSSFVYHFPMLPIRPGPYSWFVTLFDETGLLDRWHVVPDLLIATEEYQHRMDEWRGFLNLPTKFEVVVDKIVSESRS